jgi:vesicle-fusing ATPase
MQELYTTCQDFIKSVKNSQSTSLLTVLLEGVSGSGKTALAAKLAMESDFLFVKMISPEMFVGKPDFTKVQEIVKVFEDAYKSNLSLIILDDIERLIEFIHIGSRFSNLLLQALLILVKKKAPNPERKLLIIGTTAQKAVLDELELTASFNVCKRVGTVTDVKEITSVLSNYKVSS